MFYLFVFWIVLECTTTVFYWIHSNWEKNLSKVRRPWTQAWKENTIIQIEIQSQEVAVTKHKAHVLQTVISMPTAGRRWAANVALYSFKWCWLKQNNRLMDDKKNPEANDVPEGVRLSCLLITRQSVGKVWPTLGWCDAEGQRRREENKKTSKRGQREFFSFFFFFPVLPQSFCSETSLRCNSYYGARNCLMCLFLVLMQPAHRKTEHGSHREGRYNKTCKHNLSN